MIGDVVAAIVLFFVVVVVPLTMYALGSRNGYSEALRDINESGWIVTRKKD